MYQVAGTGLQGKCSLIHGRRFPLESHSSLVRLQCHGVEWWVKGSVEEVGWSSLEDEVKWLDCPMTKISLK
jgi:hypothetical protein